MKKYTSYTRKALTIFALLIITKSGISSSWNCTVKKKKADKNHMGGLGLKLLFLNHDVITEKIKSY
jgi:hypothetical protein